MLILDEPANGLDPAGIRWMRDLLRDYADGGATVLLSHLLHEIEVIADDLVVIGQGRIVAQGTKTELLLEAAGTLVRTPHVHHLAGALTASGLAFTPSTATGSTDALRVEADPELVGQVAQRAGVALVEPRRRGRGLEEMFLELTADTQREGAAA